MPSRLVSSLWFGTAFSIGVAVAAITCTPNPVLPGLGSGASGSSCSYPRGCYLVSQSGPYAGQCADCTGGPQHCRLYFIPTPFVQSPYDLGGVFVPAGADLGGTGLSFPGGAGPGPSDQPAVCGLYAEYGPLPADTQTACAPPETLCVARGPSCASSSFCVRGGNACATGIPYAPQRKPGTVGPDTYCPYTDDICCPAAAGPDGGMSPDAGPQDAAPADATIG